MTKAAIEQLTFDYRDLTPNDRSFIKERALLIRDAAKRTAEGIILIGQWLTEAKSRLKHGQWLPWLETEFGWSVSTATNFMRVYENVKLATVANLQIDVSALYLIATPKTPEPVREEIIKRAQSGEPMTKAKAVEVLESYKQRAEVPSPAVARKIAIATGIPTAASNNTYILPISKEAEDKLGAEQDKIRGIYSAIEVIVNAGITPEMMVRLGRKHACRFLNKWSAEASQWLSDVATEGAKQ
jgi:hypothetical protein